MSGRHLSGTIRNSFFRRSRDESRNLLLVQVRVPRRHHGGRESAGGLLTALSRVDPPGRLDQRREIVRRLRQPPGAPVLDEFRQAAAGQPYRRRAEGQCLDYRRPSWLFPLQPSLLALPTPAETGRPARTPPASSAPDPPRCRSTAPGCRQRAGAPRPLSSRHPGWRPRHRLPRSVPPAAGPTGPASTRSKPAP